MFEDSSRHKKKCILILDVGIQCEGHKLVTIKYSVQGPGTNH